MVTVLKGIEKALYDIRNELNVNNSLLKQLVSEQLENESAFEKEQVDEMLVLREELEKSNENEYQLEGELFEKLTGVYLNEEIERIKTNKSKKSSRRVSVNLNKELKSFFEKHLGDINFEIERVKEGILIFYVDGNPVAAVKLITDLGFCRSEDFFDVVNHIVGICKKYEVERENVFFIISTLRNGIEKPYVEKLLAHTISSNDEFLKNHMWVKKFIEEYKSRVTGLPNPMEQIHVLASELHPNTLSEQLIHASDFKDIYREELKKYQWHSNLTELFTDLHEIIIKDKNLRK